MAGISQGGPTPESSSFFKYDYHNSRRFWLSVVAVIVIVFVLDQMGIIDIDPS